MPSKDYRIWLSDHAYLVVAFVVVKGEIVTFVVRLMLMQDGGPQVNVARYDTAHGMAHCDAQASGSAGTPLRRRSLLLRPGPIASGRNGAAKCVERGRRV